MAAGASSAFLPEELMVEILSFLPVKSLIRLKCVSKSCNSLISKSTFVKLHLNRSSQNTNITFDAPQFTNIDCGSFKSISFTVIRMLDNPPTFITTRRPNHYHQLNGIDNCSVIGSFNGLICLAAHSFNREYKESWFHIWNPATRTLSGNLASYCHKFGILNNLTFGYDSSKDTFKLVRFLHRTTNVSVFSLGVDNVWRNIENSPVSYNNRGMEVVHFSCSAIWLALAIHNYNDNFINIEQLVIISLDLSTETNEVSFVLPNLSVLNDCLCFCHAHKETHFN